MNLDLSPLAKTDNSTLNTLTTTPESTFEILSDIHRKILDNKELRFQDIQEASQILIRAIHSKLKKENPASTAESPITTHLVGDQKLRGITVNISNKKLTTKDTVVDVKNLKIFSKNPFNSWYQETPISGEISIDQSNGEMLSLNYQDGKLTLEINNQVIDQQEANIEPILNNLLRTAEDVLL